MAVFDLEGLKKASERIAYSMKSKYVDDVGDDPELLEMISKAQSMRSMVHRYHKEYMGLRSRTIGVPSYDWNSNELTVAEKKALGMMLSNVYALHALYEIFIENMFGGTDSE